MKSLKILLLAGCFATGIVFTDPLLAQNDVDTSAIPEVQTTTVSGRIQLPEGDRADDLALGDTVVRIANAIELSPYPTPDNWTDLTRDEQIEWVKAFRETEEFRELVRHNEALKASQVVHTTEAAEDGTFSFDGLKADNYQLQALIMRADAGDSLDPRLAQAHLSMKFEVDQTDEPVELGDLVLQIQTFLSPGDPAPDWTGTDYDGSEISLSDFRGKFVLLDFWATWCRPCIAEVPNLEAVYADYGGERFEIIGLSLDATIDLPRNYHAEHPSPYTQIYLGRWHVETTTHDYGVHGIPSIWLIGPDGTIVARDLRGDALREAVRSALEDENVE